MKDSSKLLSISNIDNYMKNVVTNHDNDDCLYGINNRYDTCTFMKQVYNTDPVIIGDGYTLSTNPDNWQIYNESTYDHIDCNNTTNCIIDGSECYNDYYNNNLKINDGRYYNSIKNCNLQMTNVANMPNIITGNGNNDISLNNMLIYNNNNISQQSLHNITQLNNNNIPIQNTINNNVYSNNGVILNSNSYPNTGINNTIQNNFNTLSSYNNIPSYTNYQILNPSINYQSSYHTNTNTSIESPMTTRSNTISSPFGRSNTMPSPMTTRSNSISSPMITRSNTMSSRCIQSPNTRGNSMSSPMITRSNTLKNMQSPNTRSNSNNSPKVSTQDLLFFTSLLENNASTPIRNNNNNKSMTSLSRNVKRDTSKYIIDNNYNLPDCYKFINNDGTTSLIYQQYYDDKTNTPPYFINGYDELDPGYNKSIDNLLSSYPLDNMSTTGTHISPITPGTATTTGSPIMNMMSSTDKFNEILNRCINDDEFVVENNVVNSFNDVLNSGYVIEAGKKYDESQQDLNISEEYTVYIRQNPTGDTGKLNLKKQVKNTNPVATSKELNECLLLLKNDESSLSYLPHVTWNWEGVHETSWWMANKHGEVKNYKVSFTPQMCGSKTATFDENNKFAKFIESVVSPGSLIQWHPGFNIPIGTTGRANLRKVLHMDRMKNSELCDPVLEANGLKVAAKSTFGDMTIVELYKAAFVLGLWDVAAYNCLKTCKRRGYTFEWIQHIQKSGKRVTLDALKYLRNIKEVVDQHKASKGSGYKKKRKITDKTR